MIATLSGSELIIVVLAGAMLLVMLAGSAMGILRRLTHGHVEPTRRRFWQRRRN